MNAKELLDFDPADLSTGLAPVALDRGHAAGLLSRGAIQRVRAPATDGRMRELLLGLDGLGLPWNQTPVDQDIQPLLSYIRALVENRELNRNLLGVSLEAVEPHRDNATLLLAYLAEHSAIGGGGLPLRSAWMWERVRPHLDLEQPTVLAVLRFLNRAISKRPPAPPKVAQDPHSAMVLAMVARLPQPPSRFRLEELLNHELRVFPSVSTTLDNLKDRGWVVEHEVCDITDAGRNALGRIDIPATLEPMRPDIPEHLEQFDVFTRMLW